MWFELAQRGLFVLDAETSHDLTLKLLAKAPKTAGFWLGERVHLPRTIMGLKFPNPVGLAAGLDKNAECIDAWAALGFGFIEVGTVTPRPQSGNPKPRLFRLPQHRALINRLGFNNKGVDHLVRHVRRSCYRGVLGINIGKNFDTPIERAVDDYLACFEKVYAHASYVTVNVSSPNTRDLRKLQEGDALDGLLLALGTARERLSDRHGRRVPLVVKIAPDIENSQIDIIAGALMRHGMDGVIATNTTVARTGVEADDRAGEAGGLSGKPLLNRSTEVQRLLAARLAGALPVIGVGGINAGADAKLKQDAGASLVQIFTGFIYRGPALIRECADAMRAD